MTLVVSNCGSCFYFGGYQVGVVNEKKLCGSAECIEASTCWGGGGGGGVKMPHFRGHWPTVHIPTERKYLLCFSS